MESNREAISVDWIRWPKIVSDGNTLLMAQMLHPGVKGNDDDDDDDNETIDY